MLPSRVSLGVLTASASFKSQFGGTYCQRFLQESVWGYLPPALPSRVSLGVLTASASFKSQFGGTYRQRFLQESVWGYLLPALPSRISLGVLTASASLKSQFRAFRVQGLLKLLRVYLGLGGCGWAGIGVEEEGGGRGGGGLVGDQAKSRGKSD